MSGIDIEGLDRLHKKAAAYEVKNCVIPPEAALFQAWAVDTFNTFPALLAELRAARAVVEAARRFLNDHSSGEDFGVRGGKLHIALAAYDAALLPAAPARAEEVDNCTWDSLEADLRNHRIDPAEFTRDGLIMLFEDLRKAERRVGELEAEVKRLETALDYAVPDGRDMI